MMPDEIVCNMTNVNKRYTKTKRTDIGPQDLKDMYTKMRNDINERSLIFYCELPIHEFETTTAMMDYIIRKFHISYRIVEFANNIIIKFAKDVNVPVKSRYIDAKSYIKILTDKQSEMLCKHPSDFQTIWGI